MLRRIRWTLINAAVMAAAIVPSMAAQRVPSLSTAEIFVTYKPTLGGHVGQTLPIYVRHKWADAKVSGAPSAANRVVLMIHGGTTPVAPGYDLDYGSDYSWMAVLARAGFDVWAMDQTGYGGSARPHMDDPCNVDTTAQKSLLVGSTLKATCAPSYAKQFNTIRGEWEEINAVVDYIRAQTRSAKISLVGWSAGGPRAGGYASLNPDKINRLFLFAPVAGGTVTLADVPGPGVPTTLRDRDGFIAGWTRDAKCANEIDPGLKTAYWPLVVKWDAVGANWGPKEGGGVVRGPTRTGSGWTTEMVGRVKAPTAVISGEFDTSVAPARARSVFDQLTVQDKVFINVACATHFMLWEKQRTVLHQASIEWLKSGTLLGRKTGVFDADSTGRLAAK